MIVERSEQLVRAVDELAARQKQSRSLSEFQSLRDDLREPAARLRRLGQARHLLRDRGVVVPPPAGLAGAREQVRATRELFRGGPENLLDRSRFRATTFVRTLEQLADTLEQHLTDAWRAHCTEQMPGVDVSILQVLGQVASIRPMVRQVRSTLDRLLVLARGLPASADGVDELHRLAGELTTLWAQVIRHLTPRVQEFVGAAASAAGFPLERYSPELLRELADLGWAPSFVVRTRGTI